MKKIIPLITMLSFIFLSASSQVNRPEVVKKKTVPTKLAPVKIQPEPASVYSLTSARVTINTGNDNKEYPSKFLFYVMENKGIWGDGAELFTQQDHNTSVKELSINSETEIPLRMPVSINAGAYTLENLQNKGLQFIIYYLPNFFADAWKIESVKLTLEFKDQYGRLHPTMANKTIQYHINNGLLTNTNKVMSGSTDVFFTPQPVTITTQ
jgi:hypothetical protein